MPNSLDGKVVIITGASSGIGAASARLLAQSGCKLTLAARSVDKLRALAAELRAETLVARADMTEPADIKRMVERTLEQFGRIDVLFANAGIFIQGDFADYDMDAVSRMLRINVDAVMRCAHAVIPVMRAQGGGDILVTSSIAGHGGRASGSRIWRKQARNRNIRQYRAPTTGGRWHPPNVAGARQGRQ